MPEYLSPGVYVEEIDAGPKPIEGVSTSTAGAVGVTARGPTRGKRGPFTGKPELVTSFAEFVRKFGGYLKFSGDTPTDPLKTNHHPLCEISGHLILPKVGVGGSFHLR